MNSAAFEINAPGRLIYRLSNPLILSGHSFERHNLLRNEGPHMRKSPCQACGACCAFFRVLYPTTAINGVKGFDVPMDMSGLLNCFQRFMKGTETISPRCIALEGHVGFNVRCSIYEHRPSTCRNFRLSWENNTGNILCDRARAVFGLQPFSQY